MQKILVRMIDRVKARELEKELNELLIGGNWRLVSADTHHLNMEDKDRDPLITGGGYREAAEGKSPPNSLYPPVVLMIIVLEDDQAASAAQGMLQHIRQEMAAIVPSGIKEACPPERPPYTPPYTPPRTDGKQG